MESREMSMMKEVDDKAEKSSKDKIGKEYIPVSAFINVAIIVKKLFDIYSANPGCSPQMDQPTPPPDIMA